MTQFIEIAAGVARAAPPNINGRTDLISIGTGKSSGSLSAGMWKFSSNLELKIV